MLSAISTGQAASLIDRNDNGRYQAHLNDISLLELAEFINDSYGIEFKGDENLFETTVSVSFENLKLEEMVKRILTGKNYVFTYNNQGDLTGVTLLPTSQKTMRPRSPAVVRTEIPPTPVEPVSLEPTPIEPSLDVQPADDPAAEADPGNQPPETDQGNQDGPVPDNDVAEDGVPDVPLPIQ